MKLKEKALLYLGECARLACPICHTPVQADESGITCVRGHHFDLSRRGTLCFTAAAGDPRYSSELFSARKRVWAALCFSAAQQALEALIAPGSFVVDAGCGEGSLLCALCEGGRRTALGADLSAEAIHIAAAGTTPSLMFVRADIAALPLREGAAQYIINMLTPARYDEFARVLGDGQLIKLMPTGNHLLELRRALDIAEDADEAAAELFRYRCSVERDELIEWSVPCDSALLRDICDMSPLSAGRQAEGIDSVTFSLRLLCGRPIR